jgi:NTP pyrophosphatase (non-canonical NTP hydrolase)
MDFKLIINRARKIKEKYSVLNRTEGYSPWTVTEYMQGFVGDVGDLGKLLMAKGGHRFADQDIDRQLAKELADCFYGIITIADELGIDLEAELLQTFDTLESKIGEREIIIQHDDAQNTEE